MSNLTPKPAGSFATRTLPPSGLQQARCFAIIHLGTQPQFFNNVATTPAPEIMLCFELPKTLQVMNEGEAPSPYPILQNYTFSNGSKAKLPGVLKSWAGKTKEIDFKYIPNYVGQLAFLNIEHVESKKKAGVFYANIGGAGRAVNPWMPDVPTPTAYNKPIYFDFDKFSWEVFKTLPMKAQKAIRACEEWPKIIAMFPEPAAAANAGAQIAAGATNTAAEDDDVPF